VSGRSEGGGEIHLATERHGSGDRVVLVHGFTQTGRSWAPIAEELARRFEVVTVDLPGHGKSAAAAARDLEDAGSMVARAGGSANYVGYSMGGRVALHAAFAEPHLVERLVLVSATPGIEDETERAARRASDEALAARLEAGAGRPQALDEFVGEWLAGPMFVDLGRQAAGIEARLENQLPGLASALRTLGTGTQRYDREALAGLAMPVLVVAGELDEKFVAIGRQMARTIGAGATFRTLPGVGHAAPFEDPPGFARLLSEWLAG
jgi:2-succinyl-6-hydroxy-2,4-cyclohexadiene-1-carboxylate synthase